MPAHTISVPLRDREAEPRPGHRDGLATTALLLLAAIAFVVYPALRPYSSEAGLDGARAYASTLWIAAHLVGMVGFVSLAAVAPRLGLPGWVTGLLRLATVLLLPYYGAEAFGLHALGQTALARQEPDLTAVASLVRYQPVAVTIFGAALLLLAAAGVGIAVALRRARPVVVRVAGLLVGLGLLGYLPQFFGPPWLRVVHGVVLAAGLVLLVRRPDDRAR